MPTVPVRAADLRHGAARDMKATAITTTVGVEAVAVEVIVAVAAAIPAVSLTELVLGDVLAEAAVVNVVVVTLPPFTYQTTDALHAGDGGRVEALTHRVQAAPPKPLAVHRVVAKSDTTHALNGVAVILVRQGALTVGGDIAIQDIAQASSRISAKIRYILSAAGKRLAA